MNVPELLQSLGAGGVAGGLVQYLSRSDERRRSRAHVREVLAQVESARWVHADQANNFRVIGDAIREFETAAMLARVPRDLVAVYSLAARAAHHYSWASLEEEGPFADEDGTLLGGGVDARLSEVVRDAGRLVTDYLWAPVSTRIRLARAVKTLHQRLEHASAERKQIATAVATARRTFP